ncbi:MAG: DoxX family protein [Betaproteobacteria bacterium]
MAGLCEAVKNYGPIAGRFMLAVIFVISGWGKIGGFEGAVGAISSKGIPLPHIAAVLTILIELGGAILLIIGWQTRWAATALFLFMIPTTLLFHNFWAFEAAQQAMQRTHFLKNLAIMGGLLYVMAYGAGRFSLGQHKD